MLPLPAVSAPLSLALLAAAVPAQAQAPPPANTAMFEVAAAYAAKVVASAVFVSGRTLDSVLAEELAPDRPLELLIRPLLRFDIDTEHRRVTCTLGKATATAVATGNLGCTLVRDDAPAAVLQQRAAPGLADLRPPADAVDWPLGEQVPKAEPDDGVDRKVLERALDVAFADARDGRKVRTRAVVVVHRGRLVAERYAAGYHAAMPLPGWSMTKTITAALVGIRVRQGELDLAAPLRVPEWPADDPRRALRLPDLLAMTSGLQWSENYERPDSDALQMLFGSSDHAAVQARLPFGMPRQSQFRYSSGTTNLICRELRATFAKDLDYWAFPRSALFGPLGMRSAVVETDPSGTFVGSSYGFATARDWARFGMLFAQDGVWAGERLLPAGWIASCAKPAPGSKGDFGRHVWLNADPDGDGPQQREWPDLPDDLLRMDGHEGQYVAVLPSQQLVVVRLGCTKAGGFDLHALLRAATDACR